MSAHSIQDYLDKVGDVAWLLHECCSRVPDEAEPLRLLLEYGVARATKELDLRHLRRAGEGAAAEGGEAAVEDALAHGAATSACALSDAQLVETRARLLRYRERVETSVALCAEESGEEPHDEPHRSPLPLPPTPNPQSLPLPVPLAPTLTPIPLTRRGATRRGRGLRARRLHCSARLRAAGGG